MEKEAWSSAVVRVTMSDPVKGWFSMILRAALCWRCVGVNRHVRSVATRNMIMKRFLSASQRQTSEA